MIRLSLNIPSSARYDQRNMPDLQLKLEKSSWYYLNDSKNKVSILQLTSSEMLKLKMIKLVFLCPLIIDIEGLELL